MPVIFISRGTMSGVSLVVKLLHERAGIKCVSWEDLREKVNRHGDIATKILQKLPQAVSDYEKFSRLRWPFLVLMRKALLEEITGENMIYHGFSGHFLLPDVRHFVRVRIHAPVPLRVKMTMERLSCDEDSAREYISTADEQRVKWARFIYAKDVRNPLHYDFWINLGHVSLKSVCGILEAILEEEDFQPTSESLAEVERLKIASTIEEALVLDPRTAELEISAEVRDEGITLIGPYLEKGKIDVVIEIARSVTDVAEVCYTPGYKEKLSFGVMTTIE